MSGKKVELQPFITTNKNLTLCAQFREQLFNLNPILSIPVQYSL